MATILCIDDHKYGSAALHAALEAHGYPVVVACDVRDAVALTSGGRVDAVVLDCHMEGGALADVANAIRGVSPRTPIVMLSACCGQLCERFVLADACVRKGSPAALREALDLVIRAAQYGLCRSVADTLAA